MCLNTIKKLYTKIKTMKMKLILAGSILAASMFACNSDKKTDAVAVDSIGVEKIYTITPEESTISWEGNMVNFYKHNGNIKLMSGMLNVTGLQVTGGSFGVDMKSIEPLDSNYGAENPKEHLVGHLGGPEFFAVDSFPAALFVIQSVKGNTATGDLTLRGITKQETITDIVVDTTNGVKATGKLVINRQNYKVAYKAAKDKVLSDDIKLDITLVGKK